MRRLQAQTLGMLMWAALSGLTACFPFQPSDGGGQTAFAPPRQVDATDVAVPEQYRVERVAEGLSFPTGVAFDDSGGVYVTEAGYSYGEVVTVPRLLRVETDGSLSEIARGDNPPWNGVTYHGGAFFIAGGHFGGGEVLRISPEGEVTVLVRDLPSRGDHHSNAPLVQDGWLYFGQGTATNSGVVGLDNADFGWLAREPGFHDRPCQDVTLSGQNFTTADPFNEADEADAVTTGAFVPFGTATSPGQVVPGGLPCSGAVMRLRLDGSGGDADGGLELVAWGFRNPFGLAFDPSGALFAVDNAYDLRGSRAVFGAGDLLWRVEESGWHGWPDFHGDRPLTDADHYAAYGTEPVQFLLAEHPGTPPSPVALLGVHSSSNGMDFSRNPAFGHAGEVFIAQFGDLAPEVGKVLAPVGFKVIRVDVETGTVHDFAVNRDPRGPASKVGGGGLERPIAARFDPSGESLYLVDFGVMTVSEAGPAPWPGTGVLWRIHKETP